SFQGLIFSNVLLSRLKNNTTSVFKYLSSVLFEEYTWMKEGPNAGKFPLSIFKHRYVKTYPTKKLVFPVTCDNIEIKRDPLERQQEGTLLGATMPKGGPHFAMYVHYAI
ncbi:hypothetical protein ACJX0J_026202, partial [Zea mays]